MTKEHTNKRRKLENDFREIITNDGVRVNNEDDKSGNDKIRAQSEPFCGVLMGLIVCIADIRACVGSRRGGTGG